MEDVEEENEEEEEEEEEEEKKKKKKKKTIRTKVKLTPCVANHTFVVGATTAATAVVSGCRMNSS